MATIIIPTPLRKFTDHNARVMLSVRSVSDAIVKLTNNYPELKKHLFDTDGKMAPYVNIFVDSEDIRNLDLEKTIVQENTTICIVPAIAGGSEFPGDRNSVPNRIQLVKK